MFESTVVISAMPVKYIPALSFGLLTPFFDSFQKWGAREKTFKPMLIRQAAIQKNNKVLDLGCGTGTLTLLIKQTQPLSEVTGIDIDSRILSIAKQKAEKAKANIKFDFGTATSLPYPDKSFDRVISSLMFHHLTRGNKLSALKEVFRVLKRNGEIHIADMGKPQNLVMRLPAAILRHTEEAEDNIEGLLTQMLDTVGFEQVAEQSKLMTLFGTIALYKGRKN